MVGKSASTFYEFLLLSTNDFSPMGKHMFQVNNKDIRTWVLDVILLCLLLNLSSYLSYYYYYCFYSLKEKGFTKSYLHE